jgi:hypothetical protein
MKRRYKPKHCQWMIGVVGAQTSTFRVCKEKPTHEAWCADWPVPVGHLCAAHAVEFAITHRLGQIR